MPAGSGQLFIQVSVGGQPFEVHTCGITTQGVALCWGTNEFGELGDGSGSDFSTPVAVAGSPTFQGDLGG